MVIKGTKKTEIAIVISMRLVLNGMRIAERIFGLSRETIDCAIVRVRILSACKIESFTKCQIRNVVHAIAALFYSIDIIYIDSSNRRHRNRVKKATSSHTTKSAALCNQQWHLCIYTSRKFLCIYSAIVNILLEQMFQLVSPAPARNSL